MYELDDEANFVSFEKRCKPVSLPLHSNRSECGECW